LRHNRVVIVDCAAYTHGKRQPGVLDLEDAFETGRRDDDTFVWVGLHDPSPEEFDAVAKEFELHPLAVEDAIHAHQRPKLELYGEMLFLVVKTARYDDAREAIEFAELQLLAGKGFLVTVRHGDACELASTRRALEQDPERLSRGPIAVVHAVIDRVVDDYEPVLDGLDNDIAEIEVEVFSDDRNNPAGRIYKLKRQVLNMYRAVDPLIEPLERLHTVRHPLYDTDLGHYFRDVYDHLRRAATRIEVERDLLSDVLQVNLSHVSVQQNDDMRRIAAWAAMAAVPTLLAGVWGMNFEHMPELDEWWGYPMALVLMVTLVGVLFRFFRRLGWT
jgi:magnesium transporter